MDDESKRELLEEARRLHRLFTSKGPSGKNGKYSTRGYTGNSSSYTGNSSGSIGQFPQKRYQASNGGFPPPGQMPTFKLPINPEALRWIETNNECTNESNGVEDAGSPTLSNGNGASSNTATRDRTITSKPSTPKATTGPIQNTRPMTVQPPQRVMPFVHRPTQSHVSTGAPLKSNTIMASNLKVPSGKPLTASNVSELDLSHLSKSSRKSVRRRLRAELERASQQSNAKSKKSIISCEISPELVLAVRKAKPNLNNKSGKSRSSSDASLHPAGTQPACPVNDLPVEPMFTLNEARHMLLTAGWVPPSGTANNIPMTQYGPSSTLQSESQRQHELPQEYQQQQQQPYGQGEPIREDTPDLLVYSPEAEHTAQDTEAIYDSLLLDMDDDVKMVLEESFPTLQSAHPTPDNYSSGSGSFPSPTSMANEHGDASFSTTWSGEYGSVPTHNRAPQLGQSYGSQETYKQMSQSSSSMSTNTSISRPLKIQGKNLQSSRWA